MEILVYSHKEKIPFDVLKSFVSCDFEMPLYGNVNDQIYFVFGKFKNEKPKNEKKTYENLEAFSYLLNNMMHKQKFLDVCKNFSRHTGIDYEKIDFMCEDIEASPLIYNIKVLIEYYDDDEFVYKNKTNKYEIFRA